MKKTAVSSLDDLSEEFLLARAWAHLRCEQPQCIFYDAQAHGDPIKLRQALRQAGVPALELNQAPTKVFEDWYAAAMALSDEFLIPVVVFGVAAKGVSEKTLADLEGDPVHDVTWIAARQVAMQGAIEASVLHQEFRRSRAKSGWIRIGWQHEGAMPQSNGLLLAWSSPLPLLRLRNFSARCAEHVLLEGPGARDLALDVAAQGISVTHWQIAVK